jgi:transcriptional regulator with XRE-family HTH domain
MINTTPFHEYLDNQIAISNKSQRDIAEDLNYKPNVITMIKQGRTKVPINKIEPLAKSLGVDPIHMLRLAMLEYQPDTWSAIEKIMGFAVSDNEKHILTELRLLTGSKDLRMKSGDSSKRLEEFSKTLI